MGKGGVAKKATKGDDRGKRIVKVDRRMKSDKRGQQASDRRKKNKGGQAGGGVSRRRRK